MTAVILVLVGILAVLIAMVLWSGGAGAEVPPPERNARRASWAQFAGDGGVGYPSGGATESQCGPLAGDGCGDGGGDGD